MLNKSPFHRKPSIGPVCFVKRYLLFYYSQFDATEHRAWAWIQWTTNRKLCWHPHLYFNNLQSAVDISYYGTYGATLLFSNGTKTQRANCTALQVSLAASLEGWCAVSVFHAKLMLGSQICWHCWARRAIWYIWSLLKSAAEDDSEYAVNRKRSKTAGRGFLLAVITTTYNQDNQHKEHCWSEFLLAQIVC